MTAGRDDDPLSRATFEFQQDGVEGTVHRQNETTWYVYDKRNTFVGYLALAHAAAGEIEPDYTAGTPEELESVTDAFSHDWRKLVSQLLTLIDRT